MTIVKICGLRTAEHALVAATAGADMLGLMFAESKRRVSVADAAAIVQAVRNHTLAKQPAFVGIFVNTPAHEIDSIAREVGLDLVQLSGDETIEDALQVQTPWIKVVRLDGSDYERQWLEYPTERPLMVDAHVAGMYGGSGALADWQKAASVAARRPLFLAGGLTSANLAAAIKQVQPWGVDVSSGVESNGVKDIEKIRAFIAAAQSV
jgi:phosphoribosylanthranilate isomerase